MQIAKSNSDLDSPFCKFFNRVRFGFGLFKMRRINSDSDSLIYKTTRFDSDLDLAFEIIFDSDSDLVSKKRWVDSIYDSVCENLKKPWEQYSVMIRFVMIL